jgi:hypothetical protein
MSLRESGNLAASNLLHEAAETTPKRAAKISLAWKKEKTARETKAYSDEEAISLPVEAQLSKQQCNTIKLQALLPRFDNRNRGRVRSQASTIT